MSCLATNPVSPKSRNGPVSTSHPSLVARRPIRDRRTRPRHIRGGQRCKPRVHCKATASPDSLVLFAEREGCPVVNSYCRDSNEATARAKHAMPSYVLYLPSEGAEYEEKGGKMFHDLTRFKELRTKRQVAVLLYDYMQPCKKGSCGES